MRASLFEPDTQTKLGTVEVDNLYPAILVCGELYVLRAYVLGFIDNVSRQADNEAMYIRTVAKEVEGLVS